MLDKFTTALMIMGKRQFLPTLEDIDNDKLKKLSRQLIGDSEKETLTNILEWQDRNIQFWWERGPFDFSLKIIGPISWMMVLIIVYPFLQLPHITSLSNIVISVITVAIIMSIFYTNLSLIFYLFLFFPFIYLFTSIALRIPMLAQHIFPYTLSYVGCLGAIVIIIVHLSIRYSQFYREKSPKQKFLKFHELVKDTFRFRLPVSKILEYRLAICRDYAKLTSALFFNYPDSKVYFFTIRSHVAMAVKIKDEYYILDKKLPVLTKDSWLKKWNVKEANVYASELVRNSKGEIIDVIFEKHKKESLSDFSGKDDSPVNTAELTEKVSKVLGINQISQKEMPDFDFRLKDYAVYYEDNDIVKHSLNRTIKNKLENEFCGNAGKISKIEINQCENKKDLSLSVYL